MRGKSYEKNFLGILFFILSIGLCACGTKSEGVKESVKKEESQDESIKQELVENHWIYLYRGNLIYEFYEDGTFGGYCYYDAITDSVDQKFNDSWKPNKEKVRHEDLINGTWEVKDGQVIIQDQVYNKEITVDILRKGSKEYEDHLFGGYSGSTYLYETSYVEPEEYTGPTSAFHLFKVSKTDLRKTEMTTETKEETEPSESENMKQEEVVLKTPFYGIWVLGTKDESEAIKEVGRLKSHQLPAGVYLTTDWSNLNKEPWYVVSSGEFATKEEANIALEKVQAAGYKDAYIKYTGDYLR